LDNNIRRVIIDSNDNMNNNITKVNISISNLEKFINNGIAYNKSTYNSIQNNLNLMIDNKTKEILNEIDKSKLNIVEILKTNTKLIQQEIDSNNNLIKHIDEIQINIHKIQLIHIEKNIKGYKNELLSNNENLKNEIISELLKEKVATTKEITDKFEKIKNEVISEIKKDIDID